MMFQSIPLTKRKKADALILPFWEDKKTPKSAYDSANHFQSFFEKPLKAGDFQGKNGEILTLYPDQEKEKRLILLGLGKQKEINVEMMRRAYGALVKGCRKKKMEQLNLVLPKVSDLSKNEVVLGVSEGVLLANYSFNHLKKESLKEKTEPLLKEVTLLDAAKSELDVAKERLAIAESIYLVRDLVNNNADEVNPQYFVSLAKEFSKELKGVSATIFDKKRLEKEKMGLILAVNRGSSQDPALIILSYKGNPKSKDHTVIVGKGVTYDTGGLNLKPTGYMETMKCDMGGAAVAFGVLSACSRLGLKKNVTCVVPTTENSIDANSYKPGDVYTSYLGKTVEIGNTDAEGRLILADALAYTVKKLHPTRIVDLATLTGAIVIALGEEVTGLMSNNDELSNQLIASGERTFERLGRLPIYDEYKEQLKSDVADIKNVGTRAGGSITAALFLKEFVGETPWAHLDIAGTAYLSEAKRYHPKYASGIGVRLLLDWLMSTGGSAKTKKA